MSPRGTWILLSSRLCLKTQHHTWCMTGNQLMNDRMYEGQTNEWEPGQVYKVNSIPHSLTGNWNHSPALPVVLPGPAAYVKSQQYPSHPTHLHFRSLVLLDPGEKTWPVFSHCIWNSMTQVQQLPFIMLWKVTEETKILLHTCGNSMSL